MNRCSLSVKVSVKFWVKPYLDLLTLISMVFITEPDYPKVASFIGRYGIKKELVFKRI